VYTDDERLDSSGDVVAGGLLAYSDVHVRHVTEEVDDSSTSRRHFSPRVAHAHEEPASHIHTHTHTPRLVPPVKLSTVGGRAFPVAGPTIWNSLPDSVISAPSLPTFRQRLKTFLFQASFPDIITDYCKKLNSLKHLVRTIVAESHN